MRTTTLVLRTGFNCWLAAHARDVSVMERSPGYGSVMEQSPGYADRIRFVWVINDGMIVADKAGLDDSDWDHWYDS